MYKINRVCVYLGGECNLQCKYCMRNINGYCEWDIDSLSGEFKQYLNNLDTEHTQAVIVTGGEPLLYPQRMKQVFAAVPQGIHKKIMTNGTLIDESFVQYANNNAIEVCLSHDGIVSEYTRGVDVLKHPPLLALLKRLNNLTVSATISNLNTDVTAVYAYIRSKLGKDFYLRTGVIYSNGKNDELIQDFDYELYADSLLKLRSSKIMPIPSYYSDKPSTVKRQNGINFNLNGDLIEATTNKFIGTIFEDNTVIAKRMQERYPLCSQTTCAIKDTCSERVHLASEHICKLHNTLHKKTALNFNIDISNINTVFLTFGNGCNFKCRHCMQEPMQSINAADKLTEECVQYLLNLAKHKQGKKIHIRLWGGEPLLYFDAIKDTVRKLGDNFTYALISNGSLLTAEIVEFLNAYGIPFILSNDGENTTLTRGVNVLEDQHLHKLFMAINDKTINMILTAHSQNIRECWQYFEKICPGVPVSMELLLHTWDYPQDLYDFDFDKLKAEFNAIAQQALQDTAHGLARSNARMVMNKYAEHLIRTIQTADTDGSLNYLPIPLCRQIVHTLNLDTVGNIYACHNSNDIVGNIYTPYSEVVNTYLKNNNKSFLPGSECLNCEYVAFCRGGCPLELTDEKRKTFCTVRKLYIEATMGYIIALANKETEFIETEFID